jgi:hypothetical protein
LGQLAVEPHLEVPGFVMHEGGGNPALARLLPGVLPNRLDFANRSPDSFFILGVSPTLTKVGWSAFTS